MSAEITGAPVCPPQESVKNSRPGDRPASKRAKRAPRPLRLEAAARPAEPALPLPPPTEFRPELCDQIIEFHVEQVRLGKDGIPRPRAVLRNHRSVGRSFFGFLRELVPQPTPGEALGVNFSRYVTAYLERMSATGKSKNTINDRKSILLRLRESWLEFVKTDGLPEDFGRAVAFLCDSAGCSKEVIARGAGLSLTVLTNWAKGRPSPQSLPSIGLLEDFFNLRRGALSSKLPDALWLLRGRPQKGATPWREHQRLAAKSRYGLLRFPPRLQEEVDLMLRFFTDPDWAEALGLETGGEWRIRWNRGTCPTASIHLRMLQSFFGFVCLKPDHPDPWLRGKGYDERGLTLPMFADPEFLESYLGFKRERAFKRLYNSYSKRVLLFAEQLLRPGTGFLRQHAFFGGRLSPAVPEDRWDQWCGEGLAAIRKLRQRIFPPPSKRRKNQANLVGVTRDPFAAVRPYIEGRDQPITVLWDLARNMEAVVPLYEKGSVGRLATLKRDIFFVKLITSNPLRCENFAMMTHIPADWSEFRIACELYARTGDASGIHVLTDETSNLYQKPDGTWWLRFAPVDFKNQVGAASEPYDVPVVEDLIPALFEYLFRHRLVLLEAAKTSISDFRSKAGLPPLLEEEALKIERCPYVFRPNERALYSKPASRRQRYTGAEQMGSWEISRIMYYRTRRHLPSCPGFAAHACRHLVASHFVKNELDGWHVAAAVLHDRPETVRKHYAWLRTADRVKPWHRHYTELKRRYDGGEL